MHTKCWQNTAKGTHRDQTKECEIPHFRLHTDQGAMIPETIRFKATTETVLRRTSDDLDNILTNYSKWGMSKTKKPMNANQRQDLELTISTRNSIISLTTCAAADCRNLWGFLQLAAQSPASLPQHLDLALPKSSPTPDNPWSRLLRSLLLLTSYVCRCEPDENGSIANCNEASQAFHDHTLRTLTGRGIVMRTVLTLDWVEDCMRTSD